MVNLLRRIAQTAPQNLRRKYDEDLFANEIMLLPYYIAAMNIEHEYYAQTGEYRPFEGICFADTLELAERVAHQGLGERSLWMTERNTERVEREKDARIMVVIGNPPYNVGQENENDNNKNRKYPVVDGRIKGSYAKDSKATLNTKLYDPYVRFFRWATDRLQGRDGVVCFVSNNSFVDQIAFDGMRQHLLQDFTQIFHLDLHGNVRKNPKLSGTTHNVFGIQVGVGITIAVRKASNPERGLFYSRVPDDWRRERKCQFLRDVGSVEQMEWKELQPDAKSNWLTEELRLEYDAFLAVGSKEAKAARAVEAGGTGAETIFKTYSAGVNTARDHVAYDFHKRALEERVVQFIEDYNAEVSRWVRAGKPQDVDGFVHYDNVKWSRNLKRDLHAERFGHFAPSAIRRSLYRPFTNRWLYYGETIVDEMGSSGRFFPTGKTEGENSAICLSALGHRAPFTVIAASTIPNLSINSTDLFQCFPLYTYDEDGSNRRDNVTDWALAQFRARYGDDVTKRDIFDYVYGLLHHPQYRERYAENLKRELPRIPLMPTREQYDAVRATGAALAALHLGYETGPEYKLAWRFNSDVPMNWRVDKKMRLTPDKRAVIYNDWLTLEGIPPEAFDYRLGNRSALEWVIDQYQVSTDSRSGITSDPNRDGSDDERQYIARLVGKVTQVSVETVRLVRALAAVVDLLAALGVAETATVAAEG